MVRRRTGCLVAVGLAAGSVFAAGVGPASASSHREAPLTAGDPKIDNTDVYAFVSPDKSDTVTLIGTWIPFEEPNGGPNFYPFQDNAHYDINIDNDGDAVADLTYRWTFTTEDSRGTDTFLYANGPVTSLDDANLLFKQTYTLQKIVDGDVAGATTIASGQAAPSNIGNSTIPNYGKLRTSSFETVDGGGRTFAGQSDDPFFLDLRVFDLLYGGNLKKVGTDTLAGYNVNSIALQVPKSALAINGDATKNPVVGIWSSTEKQTLTLTPGQAEASGDYVQVSRLGNPLVNEVVVPAGLKDAFNSIKPETDHTVTPVVDKVLDPELPHLLNAIYKLKIPTTPRNDLVEIYLTGIAKSAPTLDGTAPPIQADLNSQVLNGDADATKFVPSEMLRLNMGVPSAKNPNRLGVIGGDFQGFPNGRRLTDDVLDISLQAVAGAAQSGKIVAPLKDGDKVNANGQKFGKVFPYLPLPNTMMANGWKAKQAQMESASAVAAPGASGGPSAQDPASSLLGGQTGQTLAGGLGLLFVSGGALVLARGRKLRPGSPARRPSAQPA
ncbi:DUF4331 domain-containing protein [Kineosporia mesophila]|uniref:DUF4331 domain-containing protein n=1 Tax=Kineosporia mesophila TaxID=566012 RepID=UPI001E344356|nr:DUF4331 domain-containing protein [Kineosporia mesophila]MCD5352822.1 DUF4331 domain-containing protein [Kineosporia mesophila]